MAESKIAFQLGRLSFSGEGSESWLSKQLEFLLAKIPELTSLPQMQEGEPDNEAPAASKPKIAVGSLASHIKAKGGDSNQAQRFLATADWLRLKGDSALKTGSVSKALQDNHQKKLSNPADCLNKNVAKGLLEKTSDGFFVTPEGLSALGHSA